jgi:glucokinase
VTAIPILEVGGTHVTAAWVHPQEWQVSAAVRRELDGRADSAVLIKEFAAAAAALDADPGSDWGVAMPGPFDYSAGIAWYVGVGKFDSLHGIDVRRELLAAMPNRPGSISFINDASAFLVGEWLAGQARGTSRSAAVTLGTGIGSAFLADGQVIDSGPDVPPDAEAHLLFHEGRPLEELVSRRALRRRFAELASRSDEPDVREIADLARSGDATAAKVFDTAFELLGRVLGPWMNRFGAEVIVLGGSISRAWDLIADPLHRGLSISGDIPVRLTEDAERSALVGSAYPAYLLR